MLKYRISAKITSALVATSLAAGSALVVPAIATEASGASAPVEAAASAAGETTDEVGTMEAQSIGLEGVSNARQLGGYQTVDGRHVKDGVLLRTGALSGATEADINTLVNDYSLGYVVDFRTSAEIAAAPDPEIDGVENVWCSVMEETADPAGADGEAHASDGVDSSAASDETNAAALAGAAATASGSDMIATLVAYANSSDLSDMYVDMVASEYSQQGYREFFDVLLSNEDDKAVLWHCTGGKDRAGLAAVLLLSALGVDEQTALDDFELTNEFNSAQIEQMGNAAREAGYSDEEVEAVETLAGVDRTYMQKAIDLIDSEYGGMDEYLRNQIGLTDEDIAQLQEMYLEG